MADSVRILIIGFIYNGSVVSVAGSMLIANAWYCSLMKLNHDLLSRTICRLMIILMHTITDKKNTDGIPFLKIA
jgi:hypothetical protein